MSKTPKTLAERIHEILPDTPADKLELLEKLYFTYVDQKIKLNKEEGKKWLVEQLKPFVEIYGIDICNEFFRYWTQSNAQGRKLRYQMEKVFDIPGRLRTWAKIALDKKEKDEFKRKQEYLGK